MTYQGIKPSEIYHRRAAVEKALRGSGRKVVGFRPPAPYEEYLAMVEEPFIVLCTHIEDETDPRFILGPGEFLCWWE